MTSRGASPTSRMFTGRATSRKRLTATSGRAGKLGRHSTTSSRRFKLSLLVRRGEVASSVSRGTIMGSTKSSGSTTAGGSPRTSTIGGPEQGAPENPPQVGTPEWGESVNLSWLVEGLAAARTPSDIGKLTRRINKALDEDIDRRDGWRIGTVMRVIEAAKERLAAGRVDNTPSTSASRSERYLRELARSGRRR